jgi:hypothetical protein
VLTIAATVGQDVTTTLLFSQSQVGNGAYGGDYACPVTPTSDPDPYRFVELRNPTSQLALVSVWTSIHAGGAEMDTWMMAYDNGAMVPDISSFAWSECTGWVSNDCHTAPCAPAPAAWAGLVAGDNHAVEVPAMGSVIVFVASKHIATTGTFDLSARTEFLQ